ncbi:Hypothetical protein FKW44_020545 [Caligus rogercresseyi]|uniref:Uncharacterized protein n=1 Tax=Caligus rogercresseyi TaxID=217165 RepID=A0A7T8GY28_CALRO|nr:Hypothetical protein FKW44_020545 [Caligus rogercresseyi]
MDAVQDQAAAAVRSRSNKRRCSNEFLTTEVLHGILRRRRAKELKKREQEEGKL